jgi:hypothetical protein
MSKAIFTLTEDRDRSSKRVKLIRELKARGLKIKATFPRKQLSLVIDANARTLLHASTRNYIGTSTWQELAVDWLEDNDAVEKGNFAV